MRKNKFLIFYVSIILILNSCGFQLRKPIELDYQSYAIIGKSSEISKKLHRQFSFADIKEVNNGSADLIIEILNNDYTKRILSLAGNGQVGEYEIIQILEYRINTKGKWSEPRKLEVVREYTYDPSLYNAAAAEEGYLRKSMEEELSKSLLTEINNIGK